MVAASVNNLWRTNASSVVFNAGLSGQSTAPHNPRWQMPSVLDFGAIGDGVTDDTAAFNAAWRRLIRAGGFYVPAASYAITGTVTGKFFSFGVVTVVGGTVTTITNLVP